MKEKSVIIVGAGFSGLSLAYALYKRGWKVSVIDSKSGPGGMIQSTQVPNHGLSESAANAFVNSEFLEDICQDISLPILFAQSTSRRKYFFVDSKIQRWPLGIFESLSFLFHFLKFLFRIKNHAPQPFESVERWSARCFGKAFSQKVLATGLLGIYASAARDLSARLVVGRFFKFFALPNLQKHWPSKTRKVKKKSISFEKGQQSFLIQLQKYLSAQGSEFHFSKVLSSSEIASLSQSSFVVLATSAPEASELLKIINPELSQILSKIPMTEVCSGTFFFDKKVSDQQGFGILASEKEKLRTLGVLMNQNIFEHRLSGATLESQTWILKETQTETSFEECQKKEMPLLFSKYEKASAFKIHNWKKAFPLYGHDLEAFLKKPELPKVASNVYLTGNYLGRIGLGQILEQNIALASYLDQEFINEK